MTNECIRRLTEIGVPTSFINQFKSDGTIPCVNTDGDYTDPSADDLHNVAEIEKLGNKVYLIIHGYYDGVLMNNYYIVSKYRNEWDSEFFKSIPHCCVGYGYVDSERTHGFYDTGMLNIFCHDGFVRRVTASEAYELNAMLEEGEEIW